MDTGRRELTIRKTKWTGFCSSTCAGPSGQLEIYKMSIEGKLIPHPVDVLHKAASFLQHWNEEASDPERRVGGRAGWSGWCTRSTQEEG